MDNMEYYNGFFSALNGYPYDETKTEEWKRGYRDGEKEKVNVTNK